MPRRLTARSCWCAAGTRATIDCVRCRCRGHRDRRRCRFWPPLPARWSVRVTRPCAAPQAPWVDYNARRGTGQYPWFPWFKEYFSVEALQRGYHDGRLIDMADFLHHYRSKWEEDEGGGLVGFCGYRKAGDSSDDCMAYSVPKGPFWRNLNITWPAERIRTVNRRDINAVSIPLRTHSNNHRLASTVLASLPHC